MIQLKKQLWSGLAAVLLVAAWSATPSYADSLTGNDQDSEASVPVAETPSEETNAEVLTTAETTDLSTDEVVDSEVVKVGEYQSDAESAASDDAIANILPHELNGRQAATLYVRNIPVLTFLGSSTPTEADSDLPASQPAPESEVKIAATQSESAASLTDAVSSTVDESDPVWRATTIAANLNQLHRDSVDAETITAYWDSETESYVIRVGDETLVTVNADTILPDTTDNPAEDVLQATNRIRRQMGSAPPLSNVEGNPPDQGATLNSAVQSLLTGMASWYGPGFDGNYSASGEIFREDELTAAHPNLPFGTHVRVTNLDNGLTVVVRINDRGPHAAGRVIDLSTAAASVIGLVNAGIAPVSLEVLDSVQAATATGLGR